MAENSNKTSNTFLSDDFFGTAEDIAIHPDIVKSVTPWKSSFRLVLWGFILTSIKIEMFRLDDIFSYVGILLFWLGFRKLRNVNNGFRCCWIVSFIRLLIMTFSYIWQASVYSKIYAGATWEKVLTIMGIVLYVIFMLGFWLGALKLGKEVGSKQGIGYVSSLVIWYLIIAALASTGTGSTLLMIVLIIGYLFIIYGIYKWSKELENIGYLIVPSATVVPNVLLASIFCVMVVAGTWSATRYFSSYPMEWKESVAITDSKEVTEIKSRLLDLGYPEEYLVKISEEDLLSCKDVTKIDLQIEEKTFYDGKTLTFCTVFASLGENNRKWQVFHHFCWEEGGSFSENELVRITPYQRAGWQMEEGISGKLYYEKDSIFYEADYYAMEYMTTIDEFAGEMVQLCAKFSFPTQEEQLGGYIAYVLVYEREGELTSLLPALTNYYHHVEGNRNTNDVGWQEEYEGSLYELGQSYMTLDPDPEN